jgi:hypothetical protein
MNLTPIKRFFVSTFARLSKMQWRPIAAYLLMFGFIITPSIGVAMIFPPAGLICFGVTCGIVGYILGAE